MIQRQTTPNEFNRQFTPHPTCKEQGQKKNDKKHPKQLRIDVDLFIKYDVSKSIKTTKTSKALGPDNIAQIMFKHLSPIATKYMTDLLSPLMKTLVIESSPS